MHKISEGAGRAGSKATVDADGSGNPILVCAQIVDHLASGIYDWVDERGLQDSVADRLVQRFEASREKSLSARDRPDFLVTHAGCAIAVEVKVQGSRNAILRQLGRYAAHVEVDVVLFASGRRTLLAGVPTAIHGTPVGVVYLGGGL